MVYLDHRRFLPQIDALRKDNKDFPSKTVSELPPPQPKTMEFVDKALERVLSAKTSREKKFIIQEVGCKAQYSFRRLPFHDRYFSTPVEPMHVVKNVSEHIVRLLSGSRDSLKVREEEKQRKRFRMSWVDVDSDEVQLQKVNLPHAPFTLSKHEKDIANNRALSIKVPAGIDWKPRKLFVKSGVGYIKSIEWKHILTCGILKYCLRGLLGDKQRMVLVELCDVLSLLTGQESISLAELDGIEYRLHRVLALLERDFPVSLHVISFHLLHHLPMYVRQFGPVHGFHMFPMERFNSWIGQRVMNRRFPETTVLESYKLFELSFFLQLSGNIPSGACFGIDETSKDDDCDHSSAVLDVDEMKALEGLYQEIDPEYAALLLLYREDKQRAKRAHRLKRFPPMSLWDGGAQHDLSPSQIALCSGPLNAVTDCPSQTVKDQHGRDKKYSAVSSDASGKPYSCVALSAHSKLYKSQVRFGKITRIIKHTFNNKRYTLALLKWFCNVDHDGQCGLYYSSLRTDSSYQAVPIEDLSKPLIYALDDHKIWFLDFCH